MGHSVRPDEPGPSCQGCGSLLEMTDQEISQAVEDVLESTRRETEEFPGVCPLCGRSAAVPVSHRKSIQFALLAGLLIVVSALAVDYYLRRDTERQEALRQALERLQTDAHVVRYLGAPVTASGEIGGGVSTDETGWQEVKLSVPVRGPAADGILQVNGGRQGGEWTFTTIEVTVPSLKRRIDVAARRVVVLDPETYVDAHTKAAAMPEYIEAPLPPPRFDGGFPCVWTSGTGGMARMDRCPMSGGGSEAFGAGDERFEVDLRFGKFILRSCDLVVEEAKARTPLTRTYASQFWIHPSRLNAFGRNSTHDFDSAPVGSRNPYTYLLLVFPDGDFLSFDRISKGTGYADAVYRHSETSSRYYKAIIRWDGNGWDTRLDDGSAIHFPESYSAKNMAQGAATEIGDARGHTLRLIRDPQRNLREIRTSGGRAMTLTHDRDGRVVKAQSDRGDAVTYRYGADGVLVEMLRSDGRARRYTYAGDLLTSVQDETGRVLLRNSYRDAMIIGQEYANGERFGFRYRMADNGRYVEEAVVDLPGGGQRSVRPGDSVPRVIRDLRK